MVPKWATQAKHQLLAEHLVAEYCVPTEGRGRKVDEWKIRLGGSENHWLDCLVGCCVGASVQGVSLFKPVAVQKRPKIRLSDIQARKRVFSKEARR